MTALLGTLKNMLPPAARRRLRTVRIHLLPSPRRIYELEANNRRLAEQIAAHEKRAALDYQGLMNVQGLMAEFKDLEPGFLDVYERCKPFTMTSIERLYSLHKCVEYLSAASIPGDFAECGVWRGGSCMMMASTLLAAGTSARSILLFDTFEGHPMPDSERDVDLWGNSGYDEWRRMTNDGAVKGWGLATLDDVRANMASTGYPAEKLEYVKGMVEDTVPPHIPERLALLRLDTD